MTGDEHRAARRQRTFKGGSISWGMASGVECTIRNLSDSGALLEIKSAVPDDFTLIIKPEGIKRSCHVIWRSGSRIGITFFALRPSS